MLLKRAGIQCAGEGQVAGVGNALLHSPITGSQCVATAELRRQRTVGYVQGCSADGAAERACTQVDFATRGCYLHAGIGIQYTSTLGNLLQGILRGSFHRARAHLMTIQNTVGREISRPDTRTHAAVHGKHSPLVRDLGGAAVHCSFCNGHGEITFMSEATACGRLHTCSIHIGNCADYLGEGAGIIAAAQAQVAAVGNDAAQFQGYPLDHQAAGAAGGDAARAQSCGIRDSQLGIGKAGAAAVAVGAGDGGCAAHRHSRRAAQASAQGAGTQIHLASRGHQRISGGIHIQRTALHVNLLQSASCLGLNLAHRCGIIAGQQVGAELHLTQATARAAVHAERLSTIAYRGTGAIHRAASHRHREVTRAKEAALTTGVAVFIHAHIHAGELLLKRAGIQCAGEGQVATIGNALLHSPITGSQCVATAELRRQRTAGYAQGCSADAAAERACTQVDFATRGLHLHTGIGIQHTVIQRNLTQRPLRGRMHRTGAHLMAACHQVFRIVRTAAIAGNTICPQCQHHAVRQNFHSVIHNRAAIHHSHADFRAARETIIAHVAIDIETTTFRSFYLSHQRRHIQRTLEGKDAVIQDGITQHNCMTVLNRQAILASGDEQKLHIIRSNHEFTMNKIDSARTQSLAMLCYNPTTVHSCSTGITIGRADTQLAAAFLLQISISRQAASAREHQVLDSGNQHRFRC